jgi:hypothetical protein
MAKKPAVAKAPKKPSLDIKDEMYHTGKKDFDWLSRQPEEMQKTFSPLIAMKWFSVDYNEPEHYIWMVNEYLNKDFWELSTRHPDLCWRIMCAIGQGRKDGDRSHGWINLANKRNTVSKVDSVFLKMHPQINNEELTLLKSKYTVDSFKELLRDMALDDKEIKTLVDEFKKTHG